jgi:uncharacterized protein with von Willebrand factor type A (vWA) domain
MTAGCYNVSDYERYLWRWHKLNDAAAEHAEARGRREAARWPQFAEEVFHRMYADAERPLAMTADAGLEPFARLHAEAEKLPEFTDLRARCRGDERWAGIATTAVLDDLADVDAGMGEFVPDPADYDAVEELLKRQLSQPALSLEERAALEESARQVEAERRQAQETAARAGNEMDESLVRNAIRAACKRAVEVMEQDAAMVDAFGAGNSAHMGRGERNASAAALAKLATTHPEISKVAEIAGRLRRIAEREQAKKPRAGAGELTGIELGADLARMVPAEAALVGSEFEMIFQRRFLERGITQWELTPPPHKDQGPIVVLLDCSGSMRGDRYTWASAAALAFLSIAATQRRGFALLHFGGSVLREWFVAPEQRVTPAEVAEAIFALSASGGTAFEPPMGRAMEIIEGQTKPGGAALPAADIIMVTDGNAGWSDLADQRLARQQAALGVRLFGVLIAENHWGLKDRAEDIVYLDNVRNDLAAHRLFGQV